MEHGSRQRTEERVALESSTFKVSRPMLVVVLNCWVIETNETPLASKVSTILAKSNSDRVNRSIL